MFGDYKVIFKVIPSIAKNQYGFTFAIIACAFINLAVLVAKAALSRSGI